MKKQITFAKRKRLRPRWDKLITYPNVSHSATFPPAHMAFYSQSFFSGSPLVLASAVLAVLVVALVLVVRRSAYNRGFSTGFDRARTFAQNGFNHPNHPIHKLYKPF